MAEPLSWQAEAIAQHIDLLRRRKAVLEASGTGFGKTYVAGFVAKHYGLPVCVVCPKAVISAWERAMADCGVEVIFATNYEQVKSKKFQHGRWKIKNRVFEWNIPANALLIFDEVHRCKTRTSQNSKILIASMRIPNRVMMMSATVAESPLHLFSIGGVLGLHNFNDPGPSYWEWIHRNGCKKDGFGMVFHGSAETLHRLNRQIFPSRGHRVRTQDIVDFPENKIETLAVDIGNVKKYALLLEKLADLEEKRENDSLDGGDLTDLLRARQEAELYKAPVMADLAIELVEEGHSVPIFVNFRDTLALVEEKLVKAKIPISKIYGGQTASERECHRVAFQEDLNRVVVCMIQAGGVGIDLHDITGKHPRVSLVSPGFNAVDLKQALGRSCRAGGQSKTVQRIVTAAGTIEKRVENKVKKKLANIDKINDGDLSLI